MLFWDMCVWLFLFLITAPSYNELNSGADGGRLAIDETDLFRVYKQ